MSASKIDSYQPLNTLKMLGEGIWMVDGPIIKMDFPLGFKMPFSTRMVVVRLGGPIVGAFTHRARSGAI